MQSIQILCPPISHCIYGSLQDQLFSSIWNITTPDTDWSYTMDLIDNPRENFNSKNIAEESS